MKPFTKMLDFQTCVMLHVWENYQDLYRELYYHAFCTSTPLPAKVPLAEFKFLLRSEVAPSYLPQGVPERQSLLVNAHLFTFTRYFRLNLTQICAEGAEAASLFLHGLLFPGPDFLSICSILSSPGRCLCSYPLSFCLCCFLLLCSFLVCLCLLPLLPIPVTEQSRLYTPVFSLPLSLSQAAA